MVEYVLDLNSVFGSLADATRRDILQRLKAGGLTVSEIARPYKLTLAAISKHLMVLEQARLVVKQRRGKEKFVELSPQALAQADVYIEQYRAFWEQRFDVLEVVLEQQKRKQVKKG